MHYDPDKITFFAETDARGKHVQFGIKAKDRQRHVYVIGKTGMGKSTLLENMAVQDIQSGEGIAFIDPHGSTAETLLNYIPEHRMNDLIYVAPFDTDNPISFNVMEDVGADKRHLVVSGLMSVFKKIWVDAWSARMEYILSNTLLALLEYPDSTLLGVNRMLSDKEYRKIVVDNVKDPSVRAFWVDEFAKYNERYMQEAGDAIKNKIGQFTANPVIRNIIGQPKSSFDIRKIMDERKILIMNLSKGLIGETNANLLGSMLTTRIYLAAMSRADLSPAVMKTMPNFYFYVDEFQSFANATFANILSEARKYHLNLTIAHQYIEQMEEEVRNAVFGNVGTIISFRVGPFDAEVLETIFTPQFLAADIVNLGYTQIYLTLMIDGIGSPPFSAVTLPPIQPPAISYRDAAIARSRDTYTQTRAYAEALIAKFHESIVPERKVSRDSHQGESRGETKRIIDSADAYKKSVSDGSSRRHAEDTHRTRAGENRPAHAKSGISESHRRSHDSRVETHSERKEDRSNRSVPERASSEGEKKTERETPPSSESLRGVLARIARETRAEDVVAPTLEQKTEKEPAPSSPKTVIGGLRDVLQQIKSETQTSGDDSAASSVPIPTPAQPVSVEVPRVPPVADVPADTSKDTAPSSSTPRTPTAKELERMMRVHTHDKPPA